MAYPFKDFNIRELKSLMNYKYICIDNSLLQKYVIKDIFTRIQKQIPASVLPNQITIAGFLSMLLSFILTYLFDHTLTRASRPLILANLLCLIVYFIADGVDGIHARATKRCSPLGYLLDHGVDSLVCMSAAVGIASTLHIGLGRLFLLLLLNIYVVFYFGALQHKYTGVFVFNYISGCSEGIVCLMLLHLASLFSTLPQAVVGGRFILLSTVLTKRKIEVLLAASLLYSCVELAVVVFSRLDRPRYRQFAFSLHNLFILLFLFITGFVYQAPNLFATKWALLVVFATVFSLCYIEETLSLALCTEPEYMIFISACVLLGTCSVVTNLRSKDTRLLLVNLCATLLIFFLRTSSVVKNFCRRTGHKFVTN